MAQTSAIDDNDTSNRGRNLAVHAAVVAPILGGSSCSPAGGGPMQDVQHVSVTITRPSADVYELAEHEAAVGRDLMTLEELMERRDRRQP